MYSSIMNTAKGKKQIYNIAFWFFESVFTRQVIVFHILQIKIWDTYYQHLMFCNRRDLSVMDDFSRNPGISQLPLFSRYAS